MKKSGIRQTKFSVLGYIIFFVTIAVTVTVAVLIYSFVNDKSGGNQKIIAAVMLVSIVVLSLICTIIDVLRRKIMVEKPVDEILQATKSITNGDFTVKLQPLHSYGKYDEYDAIKENLNIMTAELAKTELLKTDFISNVSHEIKTPLAIIQNYAVALQSGKLDEPTRAKYSTVLVDASKKLSALVVNILKLNKLENQEILFLPTQINLGEMLRQTILQFEDLIDSKNLVLDCDISDVIILSSATYLEIVFNNLLSNAIKFSDNGGAIKVVVKSQGENAVVQICDNGCGISPEVGAHIFEKFYQGDTSHSGDGNGLGLALVKKVIDIIGGEISVDSGRGATFTLRLRNNDNESR